MCSSTDTVTNGLNPSTIRALLIGGEMGDWSRNDVQRLDEVSATGFDTNDAFDTEFLMKYMGSAGAFVTTSLDTGNEYNTIITRKMGDDVFEATIQYYNGGNVREHKFPVTLTRAGNGTIRVNVR